LLKLKPLKAKAKILFGPSNQVRKNGDYYIKEVINLALRKVHPILFVFYKVMHIFISYQSPPDPLFSTLS